MHATLRKLAGLTLLAALVCIPARPQQQSSQQSGSSDPVADAARKAREQKKEAQKPKKVYTDDDISTKKSDISVVGPAPAPANANAASTTAQTSSSATSPDANAATTEKEDPNSEKAWRKRFATLRTKISTAEQELDVLQREENKGSVQYYADPTKAMNEQLTRNEINARAAKIEAKKQQIAQLKQQWSDTEDALRKAGGDPGWSRE
jgi:chromosome segregation ATPase